MIAVEFHSFLKVFFQITNKKVVIKNCLIVRKRIAYVVQIYLPVENNSLCLNEI